MQTQPQKYYSRYVNGILHAEFLECSFEEYNYVYQYLGSDFVEIKEQDIVNVFETLSSYFKP